MTGEQWTYVRRLLDEALDHPEQRPALLSRLRSHDPEICDELERLLSEVELDDEPAVDGGRIDPDLCGQAIGPYTIIREIGRGGAGTVFLASREEAGARISAALKFLRKDFLLGAPRRTFQRELRVLARLDHPNIARLLDWGNVAGGLLYLAIEYVDGQPVTQYCSERRLGLGARLALFQQVCAAVEHAHRNLVVHRDLKPSNILVTSDGKVKLLDFGIAAELDSATNLTTIAHRGLTPAYASPEQIEGKPVTVATDVYSLGLVLYELLAGQLPFSTDADRFWASLHEEPAPPSKRAMLAEAAAREVAGDLDSIVLMAIRKEPDRRYPSVEQFATDLQRYREGRPVLARRGSRFYVASRFLRRNRLNVAAVALSAIALAATAGVAVWKWRDAARNLAEAQRDYQTLRSFARAVVSGVDARTAISPLEAQQRMSETVVRYLDQLSKGRQDDEELQLEIAAAYVHLGGAEGATTNPNRGDPAAALANFQKAYRILLSQWHGRASRNSGIHLLTTSFEIAAVVADPAAAVEFLSKGIDATSVLLSRYPNDEEVLNAFAAAYGTQGQRVRYTGDLQASAASFQRAVDLTDRVLELQPDNMEALGSKEAYTSELGTTLRMEGRIAEALTAQREARKIALRVLERRPGNHSRRQAAFKLLSGCETLRRLKRYPEALRDAREALSELQALAAQDPVNDQAKVDLSLAYFRLGDVESVNGQIADAARRHGEALRLRKEQYTRHAANLQAARNYQASLIRLASILPAEADFDEAIALGQKLQQQTPSDVYAAADLARAYSGKAEWVLRAGRRAEAAELLRQSAAMWSDIRKRAPLDVELAASAQETAGHS